MRARGRIEGYPPLGNFLTPTGPVGEVLYRCYEKRQRPVECDKENELNGMTKGMKTVEGCGDCLIIKDLSNPPKTDL